MPVLYRGRPFAFTWGATFAQTVQSGYPLDEAVSYPESRSGSEAVQGASGIEDSWQTGTDNVLEGAWRWIPREDGTTPEGRSVTGWNGAAGVAAFLTYARAKNVVRFYPDPVGAPATFFPVYLVEPSEGAPDLEPDFTRKLHLKLRTSDGSAWAGY